MLVTRKTNFSGNFEYKLNPNATCDTESIRTKLKEVDGRLLRAYNHQLRAVKKHTESAPDNYTARITFTPKGTPDGSLAKFADISSAHFQIFYDDKEIATAPFHLRNNLRTDNLEIPEDTGVGDLHPHYFKAYDERRALEGRRLDTRSLKEQVKEHIKLVNQPAEPEVKKPDSDIDKALEGLDFSV
jgi:hypothetical protein